MILQVPIDTKDDGTAPERGSHAWVLALLPAIFCKQTPEIWVFPFTPGNPWDKRVYLPTFGGRFLGKIWIIYGGFQP